MPPSLADNTAVADADLVTAALGGDRSAFAAIYDTYADRIHTMCVHMLADRDEAADVCGEVFLVAFQRLAQLREPARLRPWLFAICRHEVYRRTKRRRRVELVGEVNEMDRIAAAAADGTVDGTTDDDDDSFDRVAMAQLVQQAAVGLDERDRLVLELQLQGLEGDDLAAALGTSTSTSYQHVHRMRERMERSLGALLVARQGRKECTDLDALLRQWDGQFSVLWRKRIARHVDGCDTCERRRRAVPAALFGVAGASPLVVTPTSVRERVLAGATTGSAGALGRKGWRSDGFPPGHEPRRRRFAGLALALVVLGLAALVLPTLLDSDDEDVAVAGISVSATTSTEAPAPGTDQGTSTSDPDGSTSVAPTTAGPATTSIAPVGPTTTAVVVAPPSTRPVRPTTTPATTTPRPTSTAPRTTTTTPRTTTSTTTSTTTTLVPPTLRLTGPTNLYARALDGSECANQPFTVRITGGSAATVVLQWTVGRATGTQAMTRTKLPTTWTGTIHLPVGTQGTATIVAVATNATGGTGTSNTLTAVAAPCIIIG